MYCEDADHLLTLSRPTGLWIGQLPHHVGVGGGELMLNVLRCHLTY